MENSPEAFARFPDEYLHRARQKFDTGLELKLLQEYLFIPLDIFSENLHNKGIQNKPDAWLAFLSSDDPDDIISVIERYPEFKAMYGHVYEICRNIERVMGMFSEELRELDRNTVRLMIDEMRDEIEEQKKALEEKDKSLIEKDRIIEEKEKEIKELQRKVLMQQNT